MSRLTSAAARICSIESRNLAATSLGSLTPVYPLHARPRSAKVGWGTSTINAGRSASAAASRREAAQEHQALGALVDGVQERGPLGRREVGETVDAQPAPGQHRGEARVGQCVGLLELAGAEHHHRCPGRRGHHRPRVRPADDQGQLCACRQQRRDLGNRVDAADGGLGLDLAQAGPGRGAPEVARPEQEGHQPVGDLDRTVGERRCYVRGDEPDRPAAGEAAARLKAAEYIRRVDPLAREQFGGQARAGEPPRHVVLEIGVEPAVARLQLGRHAQRQHRAVQGVEPEARHRVVQPRARRRRPRLRGERDRLLVGDRSTARSAAK